jgi:hypothetical protein
VRRFKALPRKRQKPQRPNARPIGGMRVSRFENQLIVRLICGKVNHNADGFDLALHSVGRVESPLVFLYAGFRTAEPKIKAGGEKSAEA